jgi:putative tryptophan/tyrosine transport system substrate-binding protein
MVMAPGGDPRQTGRVASRAPPGGPITGVSLRHTDPLTTPWERLHEARPSAATRAVLWHAAPPVRPPALQALHAIAPRVGVRLHAVAVQRFQDVARAGAAITQAGAERRLVLQAPDVFVHRPRIVAVAAEGRRPALDLDRAWAKLGGRMAYGTSLHEGSRRVAPRRDNL